MRGEPVADETLRTSVTLPKEIAVKLKALAARRGLPVGAVAREFVILGLERQVMVDRIAGALDLPEAVAV